MAPRRHHDAGVGQPARRHPRPGGAPGLPAARESRLHRRSQRLAHPALRQLQRVDHADEVAGRRYLSALSMINGPEKGMNAEGISPEDRQAVLDVLNWYVWCIDTGD